MALCQGQQGIRYLNILRHPVGLLSTFQQLVLNFLNLDKPAEKLFQVYIPPIAIQQDDCNGSKGQMNLSNMQQGQSRLVPSKFK
jgi:hypothetical protein